MMKTSSPGSPPRCHSKIARIARAILIFLLILLPAQARENSTRYLGWIPVQCIPAGGKLVLDMHRFFNPLPGDRIDFLSPNSAGCSAAFNAEKFEVVVAVHPDANGLMDIPIRVVNGTTDAPKKTGAVLTIAVQPPGVRPGPELPSVFAEARTADMTTFRLVPPVDSKIARVSAVLELPGGDSRLLPVPIDGDLVKIPTADIPDGSWIRVVAADDKGRVSRAIRARVRPDKSFQWQDGIIYYAFTDRFVDGNPNNNQPVKDAAVLSPANYAGGDFEGIQQKVEEGYF